MNGVRQASLSILAELFVRWWLLNSSASHLFFVVHILPKIPDFDSKNANSRIHCLDIEIEWVQIRRYDMDIKSSLRNRVCGIYSDKDGFCGTGFNFNYKQCVLTAKHNVVNKEKVFVVYVLNKRPKRFSISHIHHHPSLDLSAIILKDENLEDVEVSVDDPSFSTPPIGLEVISYGFLKLQNEMSQPLKGKVIRIYGSTTDYTFELSFSPIKGNSGAPVPFKQ